MTAEHPDVHLCRNKKKLGNTTGAFPEKKSQRGKWTTTDFGPWFGWANGWNGPTGLTYGPDIDGGTWAGKSICSSICPKDPDMQ